MLDKCKKEQEKQKLKLIYAFNMFNIVWLTHYESSGITMVSMWLCTMYFTTMSILVIFWSILLQIHAHTGNINKRLEDRINENSLQHKMVGILQYLNADAFIVLGKNETDPWL